MKHRYILDTNYEQTDPALDPNALNREAARRYNVERNVLMSVHDRGWRRVGTQ